MSRKHLQGSNGNITSFRGRGLIFFFILATLAAVVPGPGGLRPAAANDDPVISGNTATYSGNQQPDPITQNGTDIYTINVQNLTTNVGSSSTGTAISLTNTGADGSGADSQALSLTYAGGTYSLLGKNYGAYVNTTGGTGKSDGGAGGAGGTVNSSGVLTGVYIGASGAIQVSGIGIGGFSYGGAGGVGKEESSGHVTGGTGGAGGAGGSVQITNNGPITTTGTSTSYGIYGQSVGGGGGTGGEASANESCYGGTGGQGGAAGSVNITTNGVITTGDSYGIYAQSLGGAGGRGGEADAHGTQGWGGTGGAGGAGGSVTVTNNAAIKTGSYLGAYGINAMSNGGSGGQGGEGGEGKNGPQSNGGDGGNGGKAGAVTVNCNAAIDTAGLALAVNAASTGGTGGSGGSNNGNEGTADNGMGGNGGGSGLVSVNVAPGITLTGGIAAASIAGAGGTGSEGKDYGGPGGNGGVSGGVKVDCQGDIDLSTNICGINGILAQSISGAGGTGGNATGSGESYGGDGGNGGAGASATVTCSGSITISGDYVHGILAQSWGGAGGAGGNAGHHPGSAGLSGAGGGVTVNLGGSIQTDGDCSYGILAQSLGGAGGSSGEGTKIITYSADAGNGADGGAVTINTGSFAGGANSSIATQGDGSIAICAQSVGGGGGTGDSASGVIYSLGGSGGSGGQGGAATVNNGSQVSTQGFGAHGIQAQSVGGGGGTAGGAVTGGVGLAMGGSGGAGGAGGQVNVITTGNSISTAGDFAHGILAESIGGGGGNGGYAASAGAGLQISMGGSGGGGGNGGEVNVGSMSSSGVITYCTSAISTTGLDSKGIFAQSVGGGGGNGGYSIAAGLASAPIAIGGTGGGGGAGGVVNVYNAGTITTSNHLSQGIFAQSVTDGGGNGGFSLAGNLTPVLSASFSVGGSGGSGGDGKAVTVYNTGSISTGSVTTDNGTQTVLGYKSCGIQAQSVGGSGGNGGWAAAGAISFSLPGVPASASMSVTVGGSGGSGGSGGNVSVYNLMPAEGSSSIQTIGDAAHGILAQSKGGSGGSGGGSVALSCDFSGKADYGFNGSAAVGGSGGSGGTGGQVTVVNENAITTYGAGSLGILAQSIGGNGGEGGWSLALGLSGSATETFTNNVSVAVGGPGGSGATGNLVQVTNTGAITTYGQSSIGIEAQSVGGNGGNGGWSVVADASLGRLNSFNPSVSVGGNGGDGATGNTVTVTNGQSGATSGAITTYGDLAQGILAQSIGGGGGNGGATGSFGIKGTIGSNDTLTLTPQVSVGGSGGTGNTGGQVTVYNYAAISTAGTKSYGIEAQSVGGSGGNGGNSHVMTLSTAATSNLSIPGANIQASAAVGGNGGNGNDGGTVAVYNYGGITTQGMQAYGIFAQSVGGGGGTGGNSYDFNVIAALSKAGNANNNNSGRNYTESISVGGNGGGASNGGTVTVNNSGAIKTYGSSAYGIFAQSVGGGGGTGGSASSGLTIPSSDYNNWKSWVNPLNASLTFTVGGNGGSCGNGEKVQVNNSGAITTSGDAAYGIYAQSLGGGGGVASYDQSQLFSDANNNGGTSDTGIMPYQMQIGGKGGAGGDGGEVQVTNSGFIYTSGNQASGIYAQSIGGGGGSASVLGGQYHNTKYKQYFTFAVDIGQSGGIGGNGGTVTVTNTANITTTGDNANGIFAQSVGGAGGSGSEASSIIQGFLWNGSVWNGASGAGGEVSVSQTGTISTSGTDAHGIVAQSMAGNDKANNVTVTLNDPNYPTATPGNIFANGLGSSGIVAQSLGKNGSGTIGITINQPSANTGIVQGGTSGTVTNADGTTTTYNAYGVLIMDGQNNTLTNHGAISTLDGTTGTAVMVQASYGAPSWGDLTISNYGTITGSVNQGAAESTPMTNGSNMTLPTGQSTITFNNNQGGTYNAGPVINLGGGTLTNSGILSLGTVQSTLTGNYTQTGTGTFQTTVNGDGSIGQLNVSGLATLSGTLQVLKGTGPFHDGNSSSFLTGKTYGNFSNLILPADTSLVNFSLQYTGASSPSGGQAAAGGNAVQIVSHVKSHTTMALGSTDTAVGGYLDQLLAGNPTGDISRILEEIQKLAPSQFPAAFESLTPGIYGANTDTTFAITRQYTRTLQQRLQALRSFQGEEAASQALSDRSLPLLAYNGSNASLGQMLGRGQDSSGGITDRIGCWIEGFGQWGSQGSVDHVSGYNYGGAGTGIGLDYAVTKNLILGANFGYSYSRLNMDNSVGNGRINSLYGSLYGTYFTERSYVEGVLSYGNHRYDNSRRVSIGALQSSNQSSHTGNAFSVLAEGGYKFPVRQWNLQPFASLSFCNLSEGRFDESGALATMQVDSRSTNSLVSELGTQVDRPIRTSKGTLVPMLKASWQHDFGVSQNSIPFTLIGAPVGVTVTQPRVSQDRVVVRAGLTFKAKGGVTSSINYMGEVGEKTQNHGVIGQVRIAF